MNGTAYQMRNPKTGEVYDTEPVDPETWESMTDLERAFSARSTECGKWLNFTACYLERKGLHSEYFAEFNATFFDGEV